MCFETDLTLPELASNSVSGLALNSPSSYLGHNQTQKASKDDLRTSEVTHPKRASL